MEKDLYTALKAKIQADLPAIKTVGLYNNQFAMLLDKEPKERPFLFPAVFIEFSYPYPFKDMLRGVQEFQFIVTTHLGFESYKDQDEQILQIKQDLFSVVQHFQHGYFTKFIRVAQRQDFNHNNTQVYETDYLVGGKDFTADNRPTTEALLTLALTGSTIASGITF